MKILYIDTETTGLTDNSAIVQISGIVEIDKEVREEFNFFSSPHIGADISEEALKIQGRTMADFQDAPSHSEVHKEIVKLFDKYIDKFNKNDKFIVAGYNVQFDVDKLKEMFLRNGHKFLFSYLDHRKLDPLHWILPLQLIGKLPELENNKLETWCKYFSIELKAHDSLEDIRATKVLIDRFLDKIEY